MQAIRLMTGALEFFSLSGACMCVNASLALQATTPSSIDRVGLSLFLHGPAANDVRRRLLQIQILVELEERPATIGQTHSLARTGSFLSACHKTVCPMFRGENSGPGCATMAAHCAATLLSWTASSLHCIQSSTYSCMTACTRDLG